MNKSKWMKVSFSDVATLSKGLTYKSSEYSNEEEGNPFITIKCVAKDGGFSKKGLKYYKGDYKESHIVRGGDIVIANTDLNRDGKIIGCPIYIPDDLKGSKEVLISMDLSRLVVNEAKIIPKYLYYSLKTLQARSFMKNISAGSTVLHLKTSEVPNYSFEIPSLEEQIKISKVISSVDKSISETIKKIDKLLTLKKSIHQQSLSLGIGNKDFIDTDYGKFPKAWKWYKLSKIVQVVERPVDMEDNKLYQLVKAKRDFGGIVERDKLLGKEVLVKSQFYIEKDDFLISKRQIVHGGCGIVPENLHNSIVSNEYNVLKGSEKLNIHYFDLFVKHPLMTQHFFACSQGVIIEKFLFKTKDWLKREIPLPPIEEQNKIIKSLKIIESNIKKHKLKLDKLNYLKKGVMNDLLFRDK